MTSQTECDVCKRKVVLVGSLGVGKTALAIRFASNIFAEAYRQTIGASYLQRTVELDDQAVCFQIWDTAGTERYHCLMPMYLRNTDIAVVVYDVSDLRSFQDVGVYLELLRRYTSDSVVLLVGNKSDKTRSRVVTHKMGKEFAEQRKLIFLETSAKNGDNVEAIFFSANAKVLSRTTETSSLVTFAPYVDPNDGTTNMIQRRRGCCALL